MQENLYFRQQVNELQKRIIQLEDDKQTRQENVALREEAEKIRNADMERLRRENAILNRKQKQKDGSNNDYINLLKEQVSFDLYFVNVFLGLNFQFTMVIHFFCVKNRRDSIDL